eukprot:3305661-Heterocapsa_arctica.AAC.1
MSVRIRHKGSHHIPFPNQGGFAAVHRVRRVGPTPLFNVGGVAQEAVAVGQLDGTIPGNGVRSPIGNVFTAVDTIDNSK